MNKTGRIKSRSKSHALRVVQTTKGVFWDVEDVSDGKRRHIISTSVPNARALATWILENIKEES